MQHAAHPTLQLLISQNQSLKKQIESLKNMCSTLKKQLDVKHHSQPTTIIHHSPANLRGNHNQIPLSISPPFKVSLTAEEELEENSSLRVIHCCFIIEKNNSANHKESLVYSFPSSYPKDIFEVISRYSFGDSGLKEINDDENDSRKIQICYDTSLFEEVRYCFRFESKDEIKKTSFERESNLEQKRYVFGIIKTEVCRVENKDYETQVIYGFVSMTPLQSCFTELLRIMLQESKMLMTYNQAYSEAKAKRTFSFAQIMKSLTSRTILANLSVSRYPINFELGTAYNSLRVAYNSPQIFEHAELFRLGSILKQFSCVKISKVLHYLLAEESLVITCARRRSLNLFMEAIQIMLRPLHWNFATVYSYSSFFLPFLSSPLPVLIDNVGDLSPENHSLTEIFVEEEAKIDQQIHDRYADEINTFAKKLTNSVNKSIKLSDKNCVIEVSESAFKIKQYVKKMLEEQSKAAEDRSAFMEAFFQSQMLSQYLQSRNQNS